MPKSSARRSGVNLHLQFSAVDAEHQIPRKASNFAKNKPIESIKTLESKFPDRTDKSARNGKKCRHFNMDLLEPVINVENVPAPPSSTVLSTAKVPDGGKIVSVRDPAGKFQVRIEYEREQILKLSASPFAILPPACIKNVVTTMPELVAPFPVRQCYP